MVPGVVDFVEGVESASAEGAENAHEDGLGRGAVIGLVAVGVLAQDHGGADLVLGEVVVRRDALDARHADYDDLLNDINTLL